MSIVFFTTLDDPLGTHGTEALGINDAGQVVGDFIDASNRFSGFLYSNGTYTTLLDPSGAGGTFARGINNAGQTVGVYSDTTHNVHGFFYSGGTFSTLDDPLGTGGTFANGINNAGQIVGEYNDSQGTRTASCTTLIIPNTSSPPTSPSTVPRVPPSSRLSASTIWADRRALL
jgi:probable HAF family extracellular repeat protein